MNIPKSLIGPAIGFCLAVLFAAPPLHAEVDVVKNIPKEIVIAGRIHWTQALNSPVVSDILNAFGNQYAAACDFCEKAVGFHLDQVRTVWFLSGKPDTAIIVLNGSFVADDIRRTFGAVPDVTVFDQPGCLFAARFLDKKSRKMKLGAVLDEGTLLVGDEKWAALFLDAWRGRRPKHDPHSPDLQWLAKTGETIALTMIGGPGRWPDFNRKIAPLIAGLWLSVDLGDAVELHLTAQLLNAKTAQGAARVLQGAALIAQGIQEQRPLPRFVQPVLKLARFKAEGDRVTGTAEIPGEVIRGLLPAPVAR